MFAREHPTTETEQSAETWAFETFARAYPHEAHEQDPGRFWTFFQRERPGVSRAEMERVLKIPRRTWDEATEIVREGMER